MGGSTIIGANQVGRASWPFVVFGGVCLAVGSVLAQAPSSTARIQDRTYKFKEAGGLDMAYSVYVPKAYNRSRKWPLMVALHGNGALAADLIRYEGLTDLAQRHGYIVVAPTGYSSRGAYGIPGRGQGLGEAEPGFANEKNLKLTFHELAELDVMNVVGMMRKEFNVDEDRIYLMGHSMGASGVYYLANQYPDRWAALAALSGGNPGVTNSVEMPPDAGAKIRHIPIIVMQGDRDETVPVERTRAAVAQIKKLGMEHVYIEVPGGDHYDYIAQNPANLEKVFFFFDLVTRRKAPGR
jgi:predicted peptidase